MYEPKKVWGVDEEFGNLNDVERKIMETVSDRTGVRPERFAEEAHERGVELSDVVDDYETMATYYEYGEDSLMFPEDDFFGFF
ncbi:hypothetical protein [Gleimia hominis]|uniref:hypothetical protein n=1 Tax=Gleimia hominis TaxID=595468 RepID=UPI000C7FE8DA|nr:hypothetical protein [Gleimia hominis]WIK64067.1 hypothetical protein CJ187_007110 [Gleimia hominis]